tara:strand:- start:422 stop:886 length:465 start_codon:yes stop_codon:yes gene_type:complete
MKIGFRFLYILFLASCISQIQTFTALEYQKKMELIGKVTVKDLAVGDSLRINLWDICKINGSYVFSGDTARYKKFTSISEVIITLLPQNQASVKINPPSRDGYDKDISDVLLKDRCYGEGPNTAPYFFVKDVNGFETEEGYISQLLEDGYKLIE